MGDDLRFYIDDSGTRHPDHRCTKVAGKPDWFALGGIILRESDEQEVRDKHKIFVDQWGIEGPLHSSDIRFQSRNFAWLKKDATQCDEFMKSLSDFLLDLPVIGHACVIDRPGYNARYSEKYGINKWSLCKTAFSIAVERAARYAQQQGARMRVFVENSSREDEGKLKEYYEMLRSAGAPFDKQTSSKYMPMKHDDLGHTLREFRVKKKSSPPMQIADLYLYPICHGGYDPTYRPYAALREKKKLIDSLYPESEHAMSCIKYSCFDDLSYFARPEKQKPENR